jgi:hypothetical protein
MSDERTTGDGEAAPRAEADGVRATRPRCDYRDDDPPHVFEILSSYRRVRRKRRSAPTK